MRTQKRMTALLIGMICILTLSFSAMGEAAAWDCPECGRKGNTGNFCGGCAHPAPWRSDTPPATEPPASLPSITGNDVGTTVFFGSYEQDNNSANGREPVEWVILDVKGNRALLISRKGLDAQPYNHTFADVTWDKCTLRSWLNEDFFQAAFTDLERSRIAVSETDNSPAQDLKNHTDKGGKNTKDQVFLLSCREVLEDYQAVLRKYPCESTEYAKAQGAFTFNGFFGWKLRTPWPAYGYGLLEVQEYNGGLDIVVNEESNSASGAIRPAIWIDLSPMD